MSGVLFTCDLRGVGADGDVPASGWRGPPVDGSQVCTRVELQDGAELGVNQFSRHRPVEDDFIDDRLYLTAGGMECRVAVGMTCLQPVLERSRGEVSQEPKVGSPVHQDLV